MVRLSWDIRLHRGDFQLESASNSAVFPLGIFGASGSGKSSLLLALAGLVRPVAGTVRLGARVLTDVTRGTFVPAHERRIGLVFQNARLFPHLSVEQNLAFGFDRRARPSDGMSRKEVLDLLDLHAFLHRDPTTLSGGERQRVAIGRALLAAPEALLLDEPLASVDDAGRTEAMRLIHRVQTRSPIPVVYVTHDVDEMSIMGRNVLWFDRGREVARGWLPDLLTERGEARDISNVLTFDRVSPPRNGTARCRLRGTGVEIVSRAGSEPVEVATVAATDITLATHPVSGVSVQNQVPGRITAVRPGTGQTWIEVDVGVRLVASVGSEAVSELSLAEGRPIWCLFKATAVRPRF